VSSLRDSPLTLRLPGTGVPGSLRFKGESRRDGTTRRMPCPSRRGSTERCLQGLKRLRENSVWKARRDVSCLRDSPLTLSLPGTDTPAYRLCRRFGTAGASTPALRVARPTEPGFDTPTEQSRRDGTNCSPARECRVACDLKASPEGTAQRGGCRALPGADRQKDAFRG
jgi:hypothetical protein